VGMIQLSSSPPTTVPQIPSSAKLDRAIETSLGVAPARQRHAPALSPHFHGGTRGRVEASMGPSRGVHPAS